MRITEPTQTSSLELGNFGGPSERSAAYLSNSSLQKQLQIIPTAAHYSFKAFEALQRVKVTI